MDDAALEYDISALMSAARTERGLAIGLSAAMRAVQTGSAALVLCAQDTDPISILEALLSEVHAAAVPVTWVSSRMALGRMAGVESAAVVVITMPKDGSAVSRPLRSVQVSLEALLL